MARPLCLVLLFASVSAVKKTTKDWSKIDFDAIESQWQDGDEADELKSEHEFYEEALARRRANAPSGPGPQE